MMEVFMDDFSVFGNSFETCLSHLEKMLKRCEDTNLCLNYKKSNFMVKEGIVLGHKISKNGIEVDKAKVDVIAKLPHPITVKGVVLEQRQEKHFRPIHYASKIMTESESNYTTAKKEMLAVVYAFEEFRSYLIMNKSIVIVIGHKISKNGIEIDKAKVDVIAKLPHPTTINGTCSFLGHAGFYRRFTQDFSKIARLMTRLLEKDSPFFFSKCSSCGALYTTDYCCSEGSLGDKIICDLNQTPDLSQQSPQNCPKCRKPIDGHYCQGCALFRKKFKEDLFTYCIKNGILQDSFEPSNDNTNVVSALQEPFVVEQDPVKIPHKVLHKSTTIVSMVVVILVPDPEPFNNPTIDELPQTLPSFDSTCYSKERNSFTYDSTSNLVHDSPNVFDPPIQPPIYSYDFYGNDAYYGQDCSLQVPFTYDPEPLYINTPNWDRPTICYDDEDYAIAVTPSLSTQEPDNSLSMGDEHLDTVSATESDEFIKSSVENLVLIPRKSKGIPNNMCDMPFHDNSLPLDGSKDQFEVFFDSNDGSTSNDDDSFSINNIEYVEASPPDSELVSSEVMEIVISKIGGIDDDILLTIKDDILHENLLNVNLLIANIKALNDNPTPSSNFMTKSYSTSLNYLLEETNTFDNSLPVFETFCFDLKEISSGSTTTHSDISLPEYEAFYDDLVKEISNGSTTTHSDSSLYNSFIFDLLINPFPPTDRSDFYEFVYELAHIISPPKV
nr:retrovirus-related Pol polyprotein [Tanacetum cinerariifolium]